MKAHFLVGTGQCSYWKRALDRVLLSRIAPCAGSYEEILGCSGTKGSGRARKSGSGEGI